MRKFFSLMVLSIMFSFPAIKDGDVVYDATEFWAARQAGKYVLLDVRRSIDPVQLTFDSPVEAKHFVDCFADWLATKK